MSSRIVLVWIAFAALCGYAVGCGSDPTAISAGDGGRLPDATAVDAPGGGDDVSVFPGDDSGSPGSPDASLTPMVFGGGGGGTPGSCLGLGAGCSTAADCCSGDCTGGACTYPACTSDHGACTSNGNCCSQSCVNGACGSLNTTCKTLGNQCTTGADCCSNLCSAGTCQASSFCGQGGDSCATSADCCTQTCTIAAGATLGTCGASPPGGPANCGVVDGQLCGGSAPDGGVVLNGSGLPSCGGPCCSRSCAPWGPTGVLVCQPASGCHVVGDLCTQDSDCCGSAGLPGGSGKGVTCVITAPATVGVCRNPMGCKPDGDVCKLKTMSCNSSCDCCSGNCETQDTCKQDNMGVPRCAAAQCVDVGGACATSANCCSGMPCVPNPVDGGTPQFVCSGTACVSACGACTDNADCCSGTSCVVAPGSTHGICGPCGGGTGNDGGPGGPGGDGGGTGSPDGGGGSGAPDAGGSGPTCALYGQLCTTASQCCNNVPCDGRCEYPAPR
jgi:hypothetical protein